MKEILKLLLAFLPWIAFLFLAGHTFTSLAAALITAALLAIVLSVTKINRGAINWVTLLFFGVSLIMVILFKNMWYIRYLAFIANGSLLVTTIIGMLIGKPFTEQYAKEGLTESACNTVLFVRACYITTTLWMLVFLMCFFLEYLKIMDAEHVHAYVAVNYSLLVAGVLATRIYAGVMQRRRARAGS